jgi:hypothetical protein
VTGAPGSSLVGRHARAAAADPCWTPKSSGLQFKDKTGSFDGLRKVGFKGNPSEPKAKLKISGKGSALPHGALPFTGPVTVQLVGTDTGVCFEASYSGAQIQTNDGEQFKAKAKAP